MQAKEKKTADIWEMSKETHRIVANHVRLLLDQYRKMRGLYGGPNDVLMQAVKAYWPQGTENYFKSFDIWLEQELGVFEKSMGDAIDEYAKNVSDLEFVAPNTDHYRMMVDEHTKLWLENYQKFKTQREQMNRESLDSAMKMFPSIVHPIIENTNRWFMEQNEKVERQILEQIRGYMLNMSDE